VDDFTTKVKDMKKEHMTVTAHMLLGWDKYFPDWYRNNDFSADTIETIMKSWLKDIIQYKGNDTLVDVWNVVNEAISWNGKGGYWPEFNADYTNACEMQHMGYEPDASGLTGNMYVNAQHPVYIRKAFEYARTLTKKKLELRDSGIEFPTDSKYNAFYQLAVHLKNMNAPVDVIGFQSHLDLEKNYDWEGYTNNIKRFRKLGYEVNIPEVDIGDVTQSWSEDKAAEQKMQYYKLVTAAIMGGASELQTWGFIDPGWRPGEYAFPYTNNYEPKPAYYGIEEALTDMSSVLYWEMDAPADNIMPDVMKYNNFGTLNNFGNPVIVPGYKGKALQFDGIDDYISTGKISDSISGNLTLCFYFKTATTKPSIIADLALNENSGLKIGINQEGKIVLEAAGSGLSTDLTGSKTVNDNNWHFLAIERDSVSFRLYVDDSSPVEQTAGSLLKFNKLTVGAQNNGTNAFEGSIDEVKLYVSAIEEESFIRSYAPYPPMKLALASSGLRIKLTWIDQSNNEDGFIVERKTGDGNWEEIGRNGPNGTSTTDKLDLYNTEYSYRVCSFTNVGKSAESNTVTYLTPQDPNTGIIDQAGKITFSVYPNPVKDKITLVSDGAVDMKIYDVDGRIILEKNNLAATETFDLSKFNSGVYFLRTFGNKKNSAIKIIKQ
jgi:endo-1,4-beta-xylanase